MSQVRQTFLEQVAPADRVPREEMLKIANSYYEAIIQDNGKIAPFADECQRRENGGIIERANNYGPFDIPAAYVFMLCTCVINYFIARFKYGPELIPNHSHLLFLQADHRFLCLWLYKFLFQ